MVYQYKMVQVPPTVALASSKERGNEAAIYLARVVNQHSKVGWEFYRVDSIGVQVPPGCLAGLAGAKPTTAVHYVITFRKTESPDAPSGAHVD